MSPIKQAASSTSSSGSKDQLILGALANYAKITGIRLYNNTLADAIGRDYSPEEQPSVFKKFRDGNQRLTNNLNSTMRVLQSFSGVLFEPITDVLTAINLLLSTGEKRSRYDDFLIELFERLDNIFTRLEMYTTIPPTSLMTELVVKMIAELLSVLALTTRKFKEGRFRQVTRKLLGERNIEDALQRLDGLTQDWVRMCVLNKILEETKNIQCDRSRIENDQWQRERDQLRREKDQLRRERDQLRRDIRHWLSPPNPSTNHNTFLTAPSARHRRTAVWFVENNYFVEWKKRGSLLWVHGKPGSGKSTLLSAIIEDIRDMYAAGLISMAYYYFDFHDVKKHDLYGLLSSLLFQLSTQSDAYFGILSRLHAENAGGTETPTRSALLKRLKEMLSLPGQADTFIIVDALDECPNFTERPSARDEVLALIEELIHLELPGLHICVASRPEMDIRIALESLEHLQISLHDESGQKEDIIAYIKAVVNSDRRIRRWVEEDKHLVVDELSQKAHGSFRWVVCQVDALCFGFPRNIRSILDDLPRRLDKTYEKALLGINEAKREYALRLYRCLTVSICPLRVEELVDILAISFGEETPHSSDERWRIMDAEEDILSACSSLITINSVGSSRIVQFSHFSIKQFLASERLAVAEEHLSYYHILQEPAHTTLAHASLSILLELNDDIDRNIIDHFPLAQYAARYWVNHAQFGDVSSQVQGFMERLFDPAKPHFSAWVWLYDIDCPWKEPMSETHPMRPEAVPLYYASLCGFYGLVEHLLVAHPQDVNALGGHHVTSLHAALDKGHVKVAQLLLQHGADSNARDGQHRTPLHIAAEHGDTEIVRLLIYQGADTNAKDFDQSIPLSLASRRGRHGAAQLLLEHDADVGHKDSTGRTPMHEALDNGHMDIVRLLLDHGTDVSAQDRSLRTPLHLAADRGDLVVAQLLLERGTAVDDRDKMDQTPLHVASKQGHLELMQLLLNHGADVRAHDNEDRTALHMASGNGDSEIQGENPNARNKGQETPLSLASRKKKLKAAQILSERGADIDSRDSLERTPLHMAAENGNYDIVHLLVDQCADLDTQMKNGRTPLHLAADQGKLKVAELLLECGAEVDARDEMDWTPLHFAAQRGYQKLMQLLLENHADVLALNREGHTFLDVAWECGHKEIIDVDARYEGGQTALHIAAQHGNTKLMEWLIRCKLDPNVVDDDQETPLFPASRNGKLDASRLLLESKAEVDHRDWQKMTPLHGASENGHDDVARLLLERNADVNAKHKNAWTPLHLASRAGRPNVAEVLLGKDAVVNVKTDANLTPLHMASQEGHLDVVDLLLKHDAEVDIQNDVGETALHLAAFYGHFDVAQALLGHGANPKIKRKDEVPRTLKSKQGRMPWELASVRGHDNMANILKLAALDEVSDLGEIPVGEPVGERQVGQPREE